MIQHSYRANIVWTGNLGHGTSGYREYSRDHRVEVEGKPDLNGSADPQFRGDPEKHNPEDLFLASISACHMLWYLHLCSVNDIIVTDYRDEAMGKMEEQPDGSGKFVNVTLYPKVKIQTAENRERAVELHNDAGKKCFIANSCAFPIEYQPVVEVDTGNL